MAGKEKSSGVPSSPINESRNSGGGQALTDYVRNQAPGHDKVFKKKLTTANYHQLSPDLQKRFDALAIDTLNMPTDENFELSFFRTVFDDHELWDAILKVSDSSSEEKLMSFQRCYEKERGCMKAFCEDSQALIITVRELISYSSSVPGNQNLTAHFRVAISTLFEIILDEIGRINKYFGPDQQHATLSLSAVEDKATMAKSNDIEEKKDILETLKPLYKAIEIVLERLKEEGNQTIHAILMVISVKLGLPLSADKNSNSSTADNLQRLSLANGGHAASPGAMSPVHNSQP